MVDCKFLFSSSLHGLIFADAFDVPTAWLRNASLPSHAEGSFKYEDYLLSTGRATPTPVASLLERSSLPRMSRSILHRLWHGLIETFPYQLVCEGMDHASARSRLHAIAGQVDPSYQNTMA